MNLNDEVLNHGRGRGLERWKMPSMGPPPRPAPKSKKSAGLSSSRTSELPWGKSHDSLVLNSSSNRRSTSSKSTDTNEEKIIVAITEGRGEARCEVGMAAINVSRPVLVLCQTSDSQSYSNTLTKLNILDPNLIIYPATFDSGIGNRLISEIRKRFPNKNLVAIARKGFNKANGLDRLYKIGIPSSFSLLMMIKNRYYALAAASGLLTYLQDHMYIYYASNSINVVYQASEGYAIIDIATADRLELVSSNQPREANRYSSLFGIMNRCLTRVGTRNLRSIVLQPLYSSPKINERLECVEELIKNTEMLLSIQGVLPKLSSVDQLLSLSTLVPENPQGCTNRQLNYLLLLNGVVDSILPLKEALKKASQPFFVRLRETLGNTDFDAIKTLIRETIHEDAYSATGQQGDQQRIWAIKPGLNGLLDLVRKTYSERIEDMREYIKTLGQKYDLPLTLANNNKKGFHITFALNQNQKKHMKRSDLPEEFIQVFRLANSFTMKTAELVNLSTRIDDILIDLFTLSNLMIHDIIVKLKQYAALFNKLVEGISYLDVLQSLAEASYANGWTRPKFDEYTEVTFGHHPLLDFLCQKRPTPNPVVACEHYNMHIVTGPNGAGKSIFIRQVMLLQIMAQAGCFVPAQTAIFRPADKMFARIGNDDDMESNASSFVLEMTEVNYILATMTDRSLIIIDELCRSTSVEEGTAIALEICDALARSGAYTFVTTHFTLLTRLADLFFNVKVWQLQTIASGDPKIPKDMKLDFRFSLIPGATTLRGYGIYMARDIWHPDVLQIVDDLQERHINKSKDHKFSALDKRARLGYDLDCKVKKLKLKKKFTLYYLNKLVAEYEGQLQTLGSQDHPYSQDVIIEQLGLSKDEASVELGHSIFDGSLNSVPTQEELSKLYLDDFHCTSESLSVENDAVEENERGDIIFSPINKGEVHEADGIILIPAASQDSVQTPVISPSQAKKRMQQMFTPDTKLDNSDPVDTSTYHTIEMVQYLEPNVDLSYSQCSLNLTQKALNLEDDQNVQVGQSREDDPMQVHQEKMHNTRNIFKGSGNPRNESINCASQLSSNALSQQLEAIWKQKEPSPNNPPPVPVVESPFVTTFARPLQDDTRKTSTPMLTKIQLHARNFENTSSLSVTTPLSKSCPNVRHVSTPKISFTIPRHVDMADLDIASVAEDLESFAEEIQKDEIDVDNENSKAVCPSNQETKKNHKVTTKYIAKDDKSLAEQHIFPKVRILQGPGRLSSDDLICNCPYDDGGTIVRPTLRNLPFEHKDTTKSEAFGSISNPTKNDIQSESIITTEKDNKKNDNENTKDATTKSRHKHEQKIPRPSANAKNDVTKMVDAFDNLSNPKKDTLTEPTTKEKCNKKIIQENINVTTQDNIYKHTKKLENKFEENARPHENVAKVTEAFDNLSNPKKDTLTQPTTKEKGNKKIIQENINVTQDTRYKHSKKLENISEENAQPHENVAKITEAFKNPSNRKKYSSTQPITKEKGNGKIISKNGRTQPFKFSEKNDRTQDDVANATEVFSGISNLKKDKPTEASKENVDKKTEHGNIHSVGIRESSEKYLQKLESISELKAQISQDNDEQMSKALNSLSNPKAVLAIETLDKNHNKSHKDHIRYPAHKTKEKNSIKLQEACQKNVKTKNDIGQSNPEESKSSEATTKTIHYDENIDKNSNNERNETGQVDTPKGPFDKNVLLQDDIPKSCSNDEMQKQFLKITTGENLLENGNIRDPRYYTKKMGPSGTKDLKQKYVILKNQNIITNKPFKNPKLNNKGVGLTTEISSNEKCIEMKQNKTLHIPVNKEEKSIEEIHEIPNQIIKEQNLKSYLKYQSVNICENYTFVKENIVISVITNEDRSNNKFKNMKKDEENNIQERTECLGISENIPQLKNDISSKRKYVNTMEAKNNDKHKNLNDIKIIEEYQEEPNIKKQNLKSGIKHQSDICENDKLVKENVVLSVIANEDRSNNKFKNMKKDEENRYQERTDCLGISENNPQLKNDTSPKRKYVNTMQAKNNDKNKNLNDINIIEEYQEEHKIDSSATNPSGQVHAEIGVENNCILDESHDDIYETALSSEYMSYSPLVSRNSSEDKDTSGVKEPNFKGFHQITKNKSNQKKAADKDDPVLFKNKSHEENTNESDIIEKVISSSDDVGYDQSNALDDPDPNIVQGQNNGRMDAVTEYHVVREDATKNLENILQTTEEKYIDFDNASLTRWTKNKKSDDNVTRAGSPKNLEESGRKRNVRNRRPTLGIRLSKISTSPVTSKLKRKVEQYVPDTLEPQDKNDVIKKIKLTDDKPVVVSDSSTSGADHKTRETTSVSEASKLRNLDGDFTSSTSSADKEKIENGNLNSTNCEKEISVTSLSEASRKRNLDGEDTSTSSADNKDQSKASSTKWSKKLKRFSPPLKNKRNPHISTGCSSTKESDSSIKKSDFDSKEISIISNNDIISPEPPQPKQKSVFYYQSKPTQKAIREAFYEEDKTFYESSANSAGLAKLWEERLKRGPRPTPRQIQRATCLATIRKTNEGVEVIPTEKRKQKKNKSTKTFSSLGGSTVNMNIFSDQNAKTFDQFIKSDNKDYKAFNFKFGPERNDGDGNPFDLFRQVKTVSSEYTQNSQSWTFVRRRSDELNVTSQPFLTPTINDYSLTPEGFYKQNREDISTLLKKYN